MITPKKSTDRGRTRLDWLDSRHSFSFGEYFDPQNKGFRVLRVINEDRVGAGAGFPTHPHHDMEILTYVLEGELEHRDSMGNGSVIRAGDLQRMSAGSGITHSEFNPSETTAGHFLQIWIIPQEKGVEPSYEQRSLPLEERLGDLFLIASPDGDEDSVRIHQDARVYAARIGAADRVSHDFRPGRSGWLQVVRGSVSLGGLDLEAGDGAQIEEQAGIELTAKNSAELLLFDLP